MPLGARIVGGVVSWFNVDRLGSVRLITSATGSVLDDVTYDAWGNKTSESDPSQGSRYGFTGREWDGNLGYQYNRDRWYDPTTGTWTTQDPDGFDAGDSNLNRYVGNGPTNATDPTGRWLFVKNGDEDPFFDWLKRQNFGFKLSPIDRGRFSSDVWLLYVPPASRPSYRQFIRGLGWGGPWNHGMVTAAVGNADTYPDNAEPYDLQRIITGVEGNGEPKSLDNFSLDANERGQVLNVIHKARGLNLADARPVGMVSGTLGNLRDELHRSMVSQNRAIAEGLQEASDAAVAKFKEYKDHFAGSWQKFSQFLDRFGPKALKVGKALVTHPGDLVSTFTQGLSGGVSRFVSNLGSHVSNGLMEWLFRGGVPGGMAKPDLSSVHSVGSFLLGSMGISWDNVLSHLVGQVVGQVGAGNAAMLSGAYQGVQKYVEAGPQGLLGALQSEGLTSDKLRGMAIEAGAATLKRYVLSGDLIKKVFLEGNPLTRLYNGLRWAFENAENFGAIGEALLNKVDDLVKGGKEGVDGVALGVEAALAKSVTPALDFLAKQLSLDGLRGKVLGAIDRTAWQSRCEVGQPDRQGSKQGQGPAKHSRSVGGSAGRAGRDAGQV